MKRALILGLLAAAGCSTETVTVVKNEPASAPVETPPEETPPEPVTEPDPAPVKPGMVFPSVLSRGGPVIKQPKIVPIVFAGDPLAADITSFTKKMAGSPYWSGTATEYAVGAITAGDTIVLSEAPPTNITSTQIETWLAGKLAGASPAFGPPDPNTLYAIFYPSGTTITFEDAEESYGQSCEGYGGYHYEIDAGGTQVGYSVVPRCSDLAELTVAASHEYFEWATDPFPLTKPAYNRLDDEHWAWQAVMIGELSDLCTFLDRDYITPTELGNVVQRHWSNKLSAAGGFPCAPLKKVPYWQAIPDTPDDAVVPDYGGGYNKTIRTKAIRVKPGGSRTVDVTMYSDEAAGVSVPLRVMSFNEFYGGTNQSGFSYSLSTTRAKTGSTVQMTIEAPTELAYDVAVTMAYTSDSSVHFWPVLILNDDEPDPPKNNMMNAGTASAAATKRVAVTRANLPKKPENEGLNGRMRRGFGTRIESFSATRAAIMAELARASLPSRMMSEP
jgi:hypothetical protein